MTDDLTNKAQADIRAITQARLTLGPRTQAPSTAASLAFALDHAKARAAVMSELDLAEVTNTLAKTGLQARAVGSAAGTRDVFIKRPDLGRHLDPADREALKDVPAPDVAIVLGDGLSAIAVALNGAAFVSALAQRLSAANLSCGPIILARQARVALGDQVALAMGAQTVVMALGERPGLSAADSLGVYVTHRPVEGGPDSARNCISNIRDAGTSVDDAADQSMALIKAMRESGKSGVALSQVLASQSALGEG